MSSDIDLAQVAARTTDRATVRYVMADVCGEWWSARYLALVDNDPQAEADGRVPVLIVGDISPLDEGLTEVSMRFDVAVDPARRVARLLVSPSSILRPLHAPADLDVLREMRDQYRVAHGLPRRVVRADGYALRHPWPPGTFVQGGKRYRFAGHGPDGRQAPVVDGAFLEAFPRQPETFLRADAESFAAAEDAAWAQWSRIASCPSPTGDHEYETRGYRNGAGICKHCDLFAMDVFDLVEIGSVCTACGVGTYWTSDEAGDLYCRVHAPRFRCAHGVEFADRWEATGCLCETDEDEALLDEDGSTTQSA